MRKIVCLCGSTKFKDEYLEANWRETWNDHIVLSVASYHHADGGKYTPSAERKEQLDALHLKKVAMADEVLVLDVGGYIGESTRRELDEAERLGKPIRYWSRDECPLPPEARLEQ